MEGSTRPTLMRSLENSIITLNNESKNTWMIKIEKMSSIFWLYGFYKHLFIWNSSCFLIKYLKKVFNVSVQKLNQIIVVIKL